MPDAGGGAEACSSSTIFTCCVTGGRRSCFANLRCAPPNVHVIAASRDRFLPGEEVFRLGGRLLQLGKDDLRLNRTELNIYARRCGLDLTEAQTERLEQTCEGWFSAVYLNLRALHEQGALLTEGTDIYEMFTAALLAPLEEDKRLLLAVMSQADEFTAEMARAVTGAGRRGRCCVS